MQTVCPCLMSPCCEPMWLRRCYSLQWRHNERGGVSNHQPHNCLHNRLLRRRSKKTSKLRVTGLCVRNSPVTGEFPAQRASNAENVSIWWRHHVGSYWCPIWEVMNNIKYTSISHSVVSIMSRDIGITRRYKGPNNQKSAPKIAR